MTGCVLNLNKLYKTDEFTILILVTTHLKYNMYILISASPYVHSYV